MYRGQRFRLYPTPEQQVYFRQCVGAARHAWNWGLALRERYYRRFGKTAGWIRLLKKWCQLKKPGKAKAWASEVGKVVTEQPFRHLESAFNRWFNRSKYPVGSVAWKKSDRPVFKCIHKARRSFVIATYHKAVVFSSRTVRLPVVGVVPYRGDMRWPNCQIRSANIKEEGGNWYLTVLFKIPDLKPKQHTGPSCGIDLGFSTFATIASEGRIVDEVKPPKPYAKAKRRLKRLNRSVSRKTRGGKNHAKAKRRIASLHYRVANTRVDFLHKLSRRVVRIYGTVTLEDLSIQGMAKFLRHTTQDLGLYEFRRQLEYKTLEVGSRLVIAHVHFPSSKLCSSCGRVKAKLDLKERMWTCEGCGATHDRDHNAAKNLEKLGRGTPDVTKPVETGVPVRRKPSRSRSEKQERT